MSRREDVYTNTEADAGRWERDHDNTPTVRIGGTYYDADDVPSPSDLAGEEW